MLGSHTGTHVDALSHIQDDSSGIEQFDLEQYVGPVDVVEISAHASVISADDIPETTSNRVIFKTANSGYSVDEFRADFVALDESAAKSRT